MAGFSADWLALREPADHAARDEGITREVVRRLRAHPKGVALDLACGTGSNARYLIPRLPHVRRWVLIDHDEALLRVAERAVAPVADRHQVAFELRQLDLNDVQQLPLGECALVTGSALLDLVSDRWLRALAHHCRDAGVSVLFPLNYDGRMSCEPAEPEDERMRTLVNHHQRSDKGLGPALGPDATAGATSAFGGWEVLVRTSDWWLGAGTEALQRELVAGWAQAAREMAPGDARVIEAWRARRMAHIDAGVSRVMVGHSDLAAFDGPPVESRYIPATRV